MWEGKPMESLSCQFCGSPLEVEKKTPIIKCQYCKRDNYFELDASEVSAKSIEDYYALLKDAARFNSLTDLASFSTEILKLDTNDPVGKYFKSYSNYRQFGNDELKVFFMSPLGSLSEAQLFITDHMASFLEINYRDSAENYLKIAAPQKLNAFKAQLDTRIETEDNYAKIPRDIFICFSSKDSYLADIVVKELEKESFSCWISSRNLRKNSPQSYWDDIEDAIKLSRVTLVLGSEKSMLSKDVQKEIDLARKHQVRLIELKIDEAKHNVYFKHAFDGNRWVDGFNDFNQGLEQLKKRIFQEISYIKSQGDPTLKKSVEVQAQIQSNNALTKENLLSTKILLSFMLLIFIVQVVFLFFVFRDHFLTDIPNAWQLFF